MIYVNIQGKRDNPDLDKNFKFYTNKIRSQPDGKFSALVHVLVVTPVLHSALMTSLASLL